MRAGDKPASVLNGAERNGCDSQRLPSPPLKCMPGLNWFWSPRRAEDFSLTMIQKLGEMHEIGGPLRLTPPSAKTPFWNVIKEDLLHFFVPFTFIF